MIKYSIIIPHYDIPQLLARCVASIPVREDIQVIIVDDCSPGAETYLAEYPFLSRPYLEFYHTDQGGSAGRARNVGLEHAKGVWLLFADADDFFVDNVAEILDECFHMTKDILFFRTESVMSNDITKKSTRSALINTYVDEYMLTHRDLHLRRHIAHPWGKMIKRNLVESNKIRFDTVKYSNDTMFSCRCGCLARDVAAVDKILYVVTERTNSLTSHFCEKEGELEIRYKVFLNAQRYARTYGYPVNDIRLRYYLWANIRRGNVVHYMKDIHVVLDISYLNIFIKYFIPAVLCALKRLILLPFRH